MYCKNCGTHLNSEKVFCPNCGTNNNINSILIKDQTLDLKLFKQPTEPIANNNTETNIINKKKKKKHIFIKVLFILILIFLMFKGINVYRKSLDKIYITNSQIYEQKDNQNFYKITDKIDKISLKIKTWKKVKKTTIKLSSYNLVLFEEEYTKNKKWKIEEISLPIGISYLEINVTLDNGNVIERTIVLYNSLEENLGKLDTKDTDNDELLNYEEEIYGTNKVLKDTDNDGLTDYEEIMYTKTMPTKYSTYNENTSDANDDYDNDGLSNLEELQLETNPIISDTDGDGLNDHEEIKVYNTDSKKIDTDEDGVTDYEEVKNFSTDPLAKTGQFSGKVESENREVGITLNNVSIQDIKNTKFEYSVISVLNENMAGYIMPAYDISTDVSFTSSNITFNFENYEISDDAIPTIYYYNESIGFLEELPTTIIGKTATTTVTHFSTYVLVDKNKFENINQIYSTSNEIKIHEPLNGEFSIFFLPIFSSIFKQPIQIIASPEINNEQAKILEEKISVLIGKNYNVEVKTIDSKMAFNVLKNVFDSVYKFFCNIFSDFENSTNNISDKSYYHNINNFLVVGYMQNIGDLSLFVGGESSFLNDNYILVDISDEKDANNDGIKDSFVLAILSGTLTTSTGLNPFEGYTFDQIQKNNDLDNDGIKNGDEIRVLEKNGKYYVEMLSNPTLNDSDFDGLEDAEDLSPLKTTIPGFSFCNSLKEDIDISYFENEVMRYNRLYNKGKEVKIDGNSFIEYEKDGEIKYSPAGIIKVGGEIINIGVTAVAKYGELTGGIGGIGDAGKARARYYDKSEKPYTERDLVEQSLKKNGEINLDSIYGSRDTQMYLWNNIGEMKEVSEENIKNGDTKVLKTTKPLIGTSEKDGYNQNYNVFGILHNSSSHSIAEVTNNNDEYTMKLRYFILDIYDWKDYEECNVNSSYGFNKCVTEVHYYNDMLLGKAKAFLVKIEYDLEVTWEKNGITTIKLLEGTPYSK